MVKAVSDIKEFREIVRIRLLRRVPPHADPPRNFFSLRCNPRGDAQIGQDKYTVFDFWATWCGPCKVISPIFERLADQFPNVEFYKVDVDAAEEIAQEVGVRAVRVPPLFSHLTPRR